MRVVLIIARILVLLLALGGAAWSAVSGYLAYAVVDLNDHPLPNSTAMPMTPEARQTTIKVIPFLLAGGLLGLIGGVLAACGYTGQGGIWMLVGGLGPVLLSTAALCGSFALLAPAGLSLLAWLIGLFVPPPPETSAA
jgi:hypothetical protein